MALGQDRPDTSKAEKLLHEYAELVVGGTWTASVKTGEFVDGKWVPDGKKVIVNREHRWMGDKRFVHVADLVDKAITEVVILGVDPDTGKLVGWNFGRRGKETWWIRKETADLWLFGGEGEERDWTVVVRFLNKDTARVEPVQMVDNKLVPDEDSWPPEVYKRRDVMVLSAKSQLNEFKTPLAIYQLDLGVFPTSKQGLGALRAAPRDLQDPIKWNGPYLPVDVPNDPWGSPYVYEQLQQSHEYRITSAGPDGTMGTDDDISIDVK
jgi:type II secretion system protein G